MINILYYIIHFYREDESMIAVEAVNTILQDENERSMVKRKISNPDGKARVAYRFIF